MGYRVVRGDRAVLRTATRAHRHPLYPLFRGRRAPGRKQKASAPTGQVDRLGPAVGRGAAPADFVLAIESDDAGDHGAGGRDVMGYRVVRGDRAVLRTATRAHRHPLYPLFRGRRAPGRKQKASAPTGQVDRLGPAVGRGAAPADFVLAIESDDAGDHGAGGRDVMGYRVVRGDRAVLRTATRAHRHPLYPLFRGRRAPGRKQKASAPTGQVDRLGPAVGRGAAPADFVLAIESDDAGDHGAGGRDVMGYRVVRGDRAVLRTATRAHRHPLYPLFRGRRAPGRKQKASAPTGQVDRLGPAVGRGAAPADFVLAIESDDAGDHGAGGRDVMGYRVVRGDRAVLRTATRAHRHPLYPLFRGRRAPGRKQKASAPTGQVDRLGPAVGRGAAPADFVLAIESDDAGDHGAGGRDVMGYRVVRGDRAVLRTATRAHRHPLYPLFRGRRAPGRKQKASAPTGQVDRLGPAVGRGAAPADFVLAIESDDAGDHGAGGRDVMGYRVVRGDRAVLRTATRAHRHPLYPLFRGRRAPGRKQKASAPTGQVDRLGPAVGRGAAPADFVLAIESDDAGDHGAGGRDVMGYRVVRGDRAVLRTATRAHRHPLYPLFRGRRAPGRKQKASAPTGQVDRLGPAVGRGAAPADFVLAIESDDAGDHGAGGRDVMGYRVVRGDRAVLRTATRAHRHPLYPLFRGRRAPGRKQKASAPTGQVDRLGPAVGRGAAPADFVLAIELDDAGDHGAGGRDVMGYRVVRGDRAVLRTATRAHRHPLYPLFRGRRAPGRKQRNKATACQSPCPRSSWRRVRSNERLRVGSWIVPGLDDNAVKEAIERCFLVAL